MTYKSWCGISSKSQIINKAISNIENNLVPIIYGLRSQKKPPNREINIALLEIMQT